MNISCAKCNAQHVWLHRSLKNRLLYCDKCVTVGDIISDERMKQMVEDASVVKGDGFVMSRI